MKTILVIEASARGDASMSHKLVQAVVDKLKLKHPDARVKTRDLSKNPLPHIGASQLAAFTTPADKHTDDDRSALRLSDEVIEELVSSDAIVLGVPMYNFSVPSALKAWIDHLVRAGKTFRYGASGPEGLVKGKKVYLAVASGGVYASGPRKDIDFAAPYLKAVLGFLGMTDLEIFRVEGLAIPGVQDTALEKAVEAIRV